MFLSSDLVVFFIFSMSHYTKLAALPQPAGRERGGGSLITPAAGRPSGGGGGGAGGAEGSVKGVNIHAAHVSAFSIAAENIVDTVLATTAQTVRHSDAADDAIASANAILSKSAKLLSSEKTAQVSIRAEADRSASVGLTIHTHIAAVSRGSCIAH